MVELTEKNLTMKPEEAVKWLGLGTETVRELLVKGVKWGEAVRMPSGRWRYIVYTAQLFNTLAVPYKVAIKKAPVKPASSTSANQ